MKVAQVVPMMNVGGVERGALDVANYLNDKGVDNIIVSGGGRLLKDSRYKNIRHVSMNVYKKSIVSLLSILKIRRLIKGEKIDIVHARSRVPAWISFFATRSSSAHFITTAHGVYKNRLFSEAMGWGKFVICPSKIVARHMKSLFGVPDEKIVIINRWVDTKAFAYTDYVKRKGSSVVLALGRISPTKGYEHLIEAFKKVVRVNPCLKLQIVGSPDASKMRYYAYLQDLVRRYSLQYSVQFIEHEADVPGLLARVRLLVAPSVIEESFGRVVIEAFSCGVPVVASNVGGYKEIIDDTRDGLLVAPGNSDQIAEAMLKILENNDYARRLAEQARLKVENLYTMEKCIAQLESVYQDTLRIERIAVIKLSSLGDLILAIPSLKLVREKKPHARITLVTSRRFSGLFFDCPYIDDLVSVDDHCKKLTAINEVARILRRKSFDYIIDLQNSKTSHLLSFLAFSRFSFGYRLRWGFLLTKAAVYDRGLDPLSSQEKILQFLGLQFSEKKLTFWRQKNDITPLLKEGRYVGINVSASSGWRSKNWPIGHVQKLIELIHKNIPEVTVVLFGDRHAQGLSQPLTGAIGQRVINLCGSTAISDLPPLIRKLKIFITPDTATLHLALALNIPTIALFGPTDHRRHTVSCEHLSVFWQTMSCSHCYRPHCKLSQESLCLSKITPAQVFSKVKDLLEEPGAKSSE